MIDWGAQLDHLRHNRRIPQLLTLGFALAILWVLTSTTLLFLPKHGHKTQASQAVFTQTIALNSLHLFGVYSDLSADLPVTTLPLKLQGTMLVKNMPNQSHALISSSGGPTKLYKPGDLIQSTNATIAHINPHYVVINDGGSMEKLPLPIKMLQESTV